MKPLSFILNLSQMALGYILMVQSTRSQRPTVFYVTPELKVICFKAGQRPVPDLMEQIYNRKYEVMAIDTIDPLSEPQLEHFSMIGLDPESLYRSLEMRRAEPVSTSPGNLLGELLERLIQTRYHQSIRGCRYLGYFNRSLIYEWLDALQHRLVSVPAGYLNQALRGAVRGGHYAMVRDLLTVAETNPNWIRTSVQSQVNSRIRFRVPARDRFVAGLVLEAVNIDHPPMVNFLLNKLLPEPGHYLFPRQRILNQALFRAGWCHYFDCLELLWPHASARGQLGLFRECVRRQDFPLWSALAPRYRIEIDPDRIVLYEVGKQGHALILEQKIVREEKIVRDQWGLQRLFLGACEGAQIELVRKLLREPFNLRHDRATIQRGLAIVAQQSDSEINSLLLACNSDL